MLQQKNMSKTVGIGECLCEEIHRSGEHQTTVAGGSVLNAIVSLARTGIKTAFVSGIGSDDKGVMVGDFLRQNGVPTDYIAINEGVMTTLSVAELGDNNDATYTFRRDRKACLPPKVMPTMQRNDVLLLGSYYAVSSDMRPFVSQLLCSAREKRAIIVYDINFRPNHSNSLPEVKKNILENMHYADIVRASRDDLREVFSTGSPQTVFDNHLAAFGTPLICTDGAKTITLIDHRGSTHYYNVPPTPTVSTIGAGDNFNAGLIYGINESRISSQMLRKGLSTDVWDRLISRATMFSQAACQSLFNYVPKDFRASLG